MSRARCFTAFVVLVGWVACCRSPAAEQPRPDTPSILSRLPSPRGIVAVIGDARLAADLARASDLLVYVQLHEPAGVEAARRFLDAEGLLNRRVYVEQGTAARIGLADNLADAVVAPGAESPNAAASEALRVARPGAPVWLGGKVLVKPRPEGTDDWSHPYHGPDNNPQSADRLARAPYLTQFIAEPKFCPSPAVTVAAGGRIFRACGHLAHKANQNALLNSLLAVNAYNGTILWKRPLSDGFMILRNTIAATPETLYLADDKSCKLLNAATGELKDEIASPDPDRDGRVWKWMALEGDVLYGLVGGEELRAPTLRSEAAGIGSWPRANWPGFDYANPKTAWAQGHTLLAIHAKTKKLLWRHLAPDLVDGRAVCMRGGRIFFLSPQKSLGCLDTRTGNVVWRTVEPRLLEAIGPLFAKLPRWTGLSPFPYVKCNDAMLFFSGPRMPRVVTVSARDGTLLWQKEVPMSDGGSVHLLLREDALYAAGERGDDAGLRIDYATGKSAACFPGRRGCTVATGSIDSIFYRAAEGTVRVDLASGTAEHIAPMRPPCYEGVLIAGGMLHWGAWKCSCPLSLYGNIALAPAGHFNFSPGADASRLELAAGDPAKVQKLDVHPDDWPSCQNDPQESSTTRVAVPNQVARQWVFEPGPAVVSTAPVAAGGLVFAGDHGGVLRALDASNGVLQWKAYTGGAIFAAPALWNGRVYAGSADGQVYAFEAATGRPLWRFRAAPAERRIPVFGKLVSTWPVAGGIVVCDGVVYAAAGIAHYDGTHVYALDAVRGTPKWYNDSSGRLSPQTGSGISVQGDLFVRDGHLCFPGGNVHLLARYSLTDGRCATVPAERIASSCRTAFYAYYPEYGQYVPLSHTLCDGRTLDYAVDYTGAVHTPLALFAPQPPGAEKLAPNWRIPARRGPTIKVPPLVWQRKSAEKFNSFVVGPNVLLAAGQSASDGARDCFLAAIRIADGVRLWREPLPASAVRGGTAVDRRGRIFVSLSDGRLLCFAAKEH